MMLQIKKAGFACFFFMPLFLWRLLFYLFLFAVLPISLTTSTMGIISIAMPIEIRYSVRLMVVKPKAFARKGIKITAAVVTRENSMEAYINLLWLPFKVIPITL